ncbi:MAG TPA: AsmA family protein, partial [Steroidobacteraceae bacterium]
PLLRGKIEIGKVALDSPQARLVTDESGRNNWDDLGGAEEPSAPASETEPDALEIPTIAGLSVKNAAVTIENRQEGSRHALRNFNLETGRLASGEPFDLETDFIVDLDPTMSVQVQLASRITADFEKNVHRLSRPKIDLTVTGEGYPKDGIPVQISADVIESDISNEQHRLEGLKVAATWHGEGFPAAGVPISLQAKELSANLAQQTLETQDLYADIAGAKLSAMLTGSKILDAPRFEGRLALAPVALRDWLARLGIELPKTRDGSVFRELSFASNAVLTKSSAELQNITLTLDDTTATGSFAITDFDKQALKFDLGVNRIDADRYLPPPVEDEKAKSDDEAPTEIPVELIRKLNAQGELRINEAVFAGMKFSKLRLGVNARDGKARFHPFEASMYGGTYSGDIGIDATGQVARVSLDEHVRNIDFAPLFKDFFETDRVSGKGNANIKLSGNGRTTDDVLKTLSGTVDFNVADGALEGADLWYEIRRARAVLKQQPIPERSGPARTPFTSLQGTGTRKNGVLANNDLNVAMQYLKVTGQGTVDIPNSTLDYRLTATVLKIPREGAEPAPEEDLVDAQIPVRVTGALTDPKVRPDLEGYLKGQVKQRLEEEKQKLEEKAKEKVQDVLKDLLRR